MKSASPTSPFPLSAPEKPWLARMAEMRFLSISFFIHLALLLAFGGIAIITIQREPEDVIQGSIVVNTGPIDDVDPGGDSEPEKGVIPEEISLPKSQPTFDPITANAANVFAMNTKPSGLAHTSEISPTSTLPPGNGVPTPGNARIGPPGFFGPREQTVNSLVGTLYDLKQTKSRKETGMNPDKYREIYRRFLKEGWSPSVLGEYFKAPQPVYSTQIMIPNMTADGGPKAFGVEKEVKPSLWLIHYQGRVSPPEDGVYHFVGGGDDVMVVRINGKVVLDRCWQQQDANWAPVANYKYGWTGIPNGFAKGDALTLKAGQFYDIEVLIGEQPGVFFYACLLVEKEGVEYKKDAKGNPILPVFRLEQRIMPELEKDQTFPPYESGGPVWAAQRVSRM